jgi:hypothetical protein
MVEDVPFIRYSIVDSMIDQLRVETSSSNKRRITTCSTASLFRPEFIQSEFSKGDAVKGRKFGKLRAVKNLKKSYTHSGTNFVTDHEMDLAASLPIAAAFRELLELKGDRYYWKADYKEVFKVAAEELYKALLTKVVGFPLPVEN